MVVVPAGEFLMGSPEGEEGRNSNEGAQHKVTIPKPFAVGRTHITRGQFAKFVKSTGHKTDGGCVVFGAGVKEDYNASWRSPGFEQKDNHPVVCINWNDATAYAEWLSKNTSRPYRLLMQVEAEYAARGITKATPQPRYFFGNAKEDLCIYANGQDETAKAKFSGFLDAAPCTDGYVFTAPVMTFKPNAFGLYDIHGNAATWTQDCEVNCSSHIVRGSSWYDPPQNLRSASLRGNFTVDRINVNGFRVARTLEP
jgi:formylglycine-generating enzyme